MSYILKKENTINQILVKGSKKINKPCDPLASIDEDNNIQVKKYKNIAPERPITHDY